jgi:hypothetical protein
MTIITELSQRKKLNIVSLDASYRINQVLRSVPKASEPKMENTHIELAKNI